MCGTSFCLAGNICSQAGDRFVVGEYYGSMAGLREMEVAAKHVIPKGSKDLLSVSVRAAELLGLSHRVASHLFAGYYAIEELVSAAENLALSHGYALHLPDRLDPEPAD